MALQSCKSVALRIKQKSGLAKRLLETKMGDIIEEIIWGRLLETNGGYN